MMVVLDSRVKKGFLKISERMSGYLHPRYAESLEEFGTPRQLPRSGGWIIERQIPGFPYRDAMGPYPLFLCQDWSQLEADLTEIGDDLVSISLVTDPFGKYNLKRLKEMFEAKHFAFKDHFVADLTLPRNRIVSRHHRKYTRRALRQIQVERWERPIEFIDEWVNLYDSLIDRHGIEHIRAFSREAFIKQLSIPGLVLLRAFQDNQTVGAITWFQMGEVAYGHLAGVSEAGYQLGAAYALYSATIDYFSDKVRWLDYGAGAGVTNDPNDGLNFFKRGWSTETRTAYFCGRIFDQEKYVQVVEAKGISDTDYFPAYRKGEFS